MAKLLGADPNPMSYITDSADSPPDADGWHTDITWIAEPPKMAFLQAIEIPARGGDTMWASLYAAYDALSPTMQQVCRRLRVEHVIGDRIVDAFRARAGDEFAAQGRRRVPARRAPARPHPSRDRTRRVVRGRRLHVRHRGHARRTRATCSSGACASHIENPNFHVRWSWAPGDLAIWDERCTNHRALSDHFPASRAMRRCTVDGDRPFLSDDPG